MFQSLLSGLTAGTINGIGALANRGSFWNGSGMGIGVLSAPSVGQAKEVARYIDDGVDDAIGNLGKKVNPPALPQADAGSATRLPEPLKLTKGLEGNVTGGAAKTSTKLLNQFNSAESLIQGAGNLTKVKAGMQGFVKGDGPSIFKAITNGSLGTTSKGGIIMQDGTIIFNHFSTKTGYYTIDIHKVTGEIFKIRITP